MDKNKLISLNVRLQPSEGSLLAEVAQWLNSLSGKDKKEKISAALTMAYLAYARGTREDISDKELVRCCWQTIDLLEKHGANLLHYFQVPNPNWADRVAQTTVLEPEKTEDLQEDESPLSSQPFLFDDDEYD